MKQKLLSALLAAVLLAALTACADGKGGEVSGSDSPSDIVSSTSSAQETANAPKSDWNPTVMQRQILLDEGVMAGVVNLSYNSASVYDHTFADDHDYFVKLLEESGYADGFDFLLSIPDDRWVETIGGGGQELYLIIPFDENARVEVNYLVFDEETNYEGQTGENLYSQSNGAPFLLKCNYSDIFPECEVIITDSNGEVLNWRPFISLRDGTVQTTTQDEEKMLYDFTEYPEGTREE